jgi:hypothetical protein
MITAAIACFAQENAESRKFYKLEFVVKELDSGKVLNSHSYFVIVAAPNHERSEIRTTTKVPLPQSGNQWQWTDVGREFDCWDIKEVSGGLSLSVRASVDGILEDASPGRPASIRHNGWNSAALVPIKKPTVIFSSDDPASKRQIQVELTATPIQ